MRGEVAKWLRLRVTEKVVMCSIPCTTNYLPWLDPWVRFFILAVFCKRNVHFETMYEVTCFAVVYCKFCSILLAAQAAGKRIAEFIVIATGFVLLFHYSSIWLPHKDVIETWVFSGARHLLGIPAMHRMDRMDRDQTDELCICVSVVGQINSGSVWSTVEGAPYRISTMVGEIFCGLHSSFFF